MDIRNKIEFPIVVGGMAGSGTRLPARILAELGVYMGKDLNYPFDNLTYSQLFLRSKWFFEKAINNPELLTSAFESFIISSFHRIDSEDSTQTKLLEECLNDKNHLFQLQWRKERAEKMISVLPPDLDSINHWGWKEPHIDICMDYLPEIFPKMKFIYIVRNGLDMAYTTTNDNEQVKVWGPGLYGIAPCEDKLIPKVCLQYWKGYYQKSQNLKATIGEENYLELKFKDICSNPVGSIQKVAAFIGTEPDKCKVDGIAASITTPSSIDRYKTKDLSIFTEEDFEMVREVGFEV